MARIRTIKPEFWSSEQVMDCTPLARLLFIGLWNFCDDAGRHPYALKQIKALVFPGDEMTFGQVEDLLEGLRKNNLITVYEVDGRRYLQVTGWHHQKIDKAQKSRHPAPHSENGRDHSATIQGTLDLGKDQGPRTKDQGMDQGPGPDPEPVASAGEIGRSVGLSDDFKGRLRRAVEPEIPDDDDFEPIEAVMRDGATEADVLEGIRRAFSARRPGDKAFRKWKAMPGWVKGVLADKAAKRPPEKPPPMAEGPRVVLKPGLPPVPVTEIRGALDRGAWYPNTWGPPIGQPGCLVPSKLAAELLSARIPKQELVHG